ncbi:Signal transduction histidine kinase [Chitinophaga sp. CF118]|uniref:hybrid sensor histidine kinase/response regulator n=1 Tax=Chitinophaga sp. CF118 TaxID=1884367 RepID=UPI0008E47C12|nr:response regulator [Chitinophaga sp. CF118]SFD03370.1 Signal transduction histidine kinase [Chitinophaga sp. CF118]
MGIPLKKRLYFGFGLALVLIVAGGIFSYITFNKQQTEAKLVEHSYEVITMTQRINRYVYEIEIAETAYRNTHVFKYLDTYFELHPKILPLVNDLKKMVADNPQQMKQATKMENDMIRLLNFWESLNVRNDTNYVFSRGLEITSKEKEYYDAVHSELTGIIGHEQDLLFTRNRADESSVKRAATTLAIDTIFTLLVAIALMILSFSEIGNRVKAQEELRINLDEVVMLNKSANENNWLLTGVTRINESLQGDIGQKPLSANCLQAIVTYLGLPAGAFYCFDEITGTLRLSAGIALPLTVKQEYALKEGIVGEAGTQKDVVVVNNIPANFWQIEAGSGETLPGAVICLPLWQEDKLIGLIELAVFKEVPQRKLDLLHTTANAIAVAMKAAATREKVMTLLQRVQEQKEILEAQQEELRQSNEELTRQSEVLQTSEEELRVQEGELRQVNDEMKVQNKALEITRQQLSIKAEELEQSSTYKSEFLANMSHELRTPLNSVLILARLLEENKGNNLTSKQIEYASIIHKSGSDLLKLINDILDLSKIEAGKVEMQIEDVSVQSMVKDLDQLFHVVAEEKNIRFISSIADGVPETIHTDKQRLEQVIKNLLSNAFKFTPKDGRIKMHWEVKPDGLHISVADNGGGIAADKKQLIFEAFHQADGSTSRKYGGTGLGLSISKELMKRLGGEILLESEEGLGSTFTVVIHSNGVQPLRGTIKDPVVTEALLPLMQLPETTQKIEDDRDQFGKQDKLILIIEDDVNFAVILRDFAREKGYKTIIALNGNDGLYFTRKYMPEAILLDMNLPLIDGMSILKILKNNEDLKHILVHVISAGGISLQVRDKIQGYTQKPLQMADLESVFTGINEQLQGPFKKVLVVSDGVLQYHPSLQSLSDERQMQTQYHRVTTMEDAEQELKDKHYDAIILDLSIDIRNGIVKLGRLRLMTGSKEKPIIVYLNHDISEADELLLKRDAAAIVRNSTFSTDRLMDELELFLYKLKETNTSLKKDDNPLTEKSLEGKKVLLADDDMRNVFSLSALLAEYGMDVVTAADGKDALARLSENPDVSIVLMDIMMPEMDGYEAIRQIRMNRSFKQLPVIALTAKAMTGDREKCIAAGASDYIAKPIDSSKLLSLMRVWMV